MPEFLQHIRAVDIIDIILVLMLLVWVFRLIRGTHATSIFVGVALFFAAWLVVRALDMRLMTTILGSVASVGIVVLVVIFQPELRRFFQMLGTRRKNIVVRLLSRSQSRDTSYINPIVKACADMSSTCTGALIVVRREGQLTDVIESGVAIDGQLSSILLRTLFFKNSPMHDGAVVVSGGRIVAAKCVLPLTTSNSVPSSFGTRHRAALGVSEVTDAIVVVVSEETGRISLAWDGQIRTGLSSTELKSELMQLNK